MKQDGRTDFDFLIGSWDVHNKRLRERLKDSTDWEEFEATSIVKKVLNGIGNFDEIIMNRKSGIIIGVTLRLFNPVTKEWSIHWADSIRGTLDIPMVGSFKDDIGEFYCQEKFEGRSIFNRFIWTKKTNDDCKWEQAFSFDGGRSWETNWIMEFKRK